MRQPARNLRRLLLALPFCALSQLQAQFTLTLEVTAQPATHALDSLYAAGNFNNWSPAVDSFRLEKNQRSAILKIPGLAAGRYEFKFTRGSWDKVETSYDGADVPNHEVQLSADTTLQVNISGWKDDFTSVARVHSTTSSVQVIDTAFTMPQLLRKRRIWVYLPPGYQRKGRKRYPVLYMHDGQNLFDAYTSAFGEWKVDESLDSMIARGLPPAIVVGIDNGPQRMTEYNPYAFRDFGAGEGDAYVDFLAKTLKPYIDKNYKTLRDPGNTLIAGSSMGGLISYYAMLKHPGVFGNGGIFSPAFWTAPAILAATDTMAGKMKGKLFFYMGGKEGGKYQEDMDGVTALLGTHTDALVYTVVDPEAGHNEAAWAKWFPEFYQWIMAEGFNKVITTD